jgi:hypothetical protein
MIGSLSIKSYKAIRALVTKRIEIVSDRIPHQFNNVPFKKILNWIRVEASVLIKPEEPWGWPTHLQIEPTALCNLRCFLNSQTPLINPRFLVMKHNEQEIPGLKKLARSLGVDVFF